MTSWRDSEVFRRHATNEGHDLQISLLSRFPIFLSTRAIWIIFKVNLIILLSPEERETRNLYYHEGAILRLFFKFYFRIAWTDIKVIIPARWLASVEGAANVLLWSITFEFLYTFGFTNLPRGDQPRISSRFSCCLVFSTCDEICGCPFQWSLPHSPRPRTP